MNCAQLVKARLALPKLLLTVRPSGSEHDFLASFCSTAVKSEQVSMHGDMS